MLTPKSPRPIVQAFAGQVHRGKILDLGAGPGSEFFANKAFEVTMVSDDRAHLLALRSRMGDRAQYVTQDPGRFPLTGQYSAIVSHCVLHTVPNYKRHIERSKQATSPGGMHFVTAFLEQGDVAIKGLQPEELRELYVGWNIAFYEERLQQVTGHGLAGRAHQMVAYLVASRPL